MRKSTRHGWCWIMICEHLNNLINALFSGNESLLREGDQNMMLNISALSAVPQGFVPCDI